MPWLRRKQQQRNGGPPVNSTKPKVYVPQTDDQLEATAAQISRNLSDASVSLDKLVELIRQRRIDREGGDNGIS